MKKRLLSGTLVLLFTCLIFSFSGMAADTIHMANHPVPFLMTESLPEGGLLPRMAIEVFERQGIHVVVHTYPTKRALAAVKDGKCDVSLGWCKNAEREKAVVFNKEALGTIAYHFAYRKEDPFNWQTLDDLEGRKIGALLGSMGYGPAFLAAESSGKLIVERVYNIRQNIVKLLAERIDLAVGPRFVIRSLLEYDFSSNNRARIAIHPRPLNAQHVFAIFRMGISPRIINVLDAGIREMKESGELSRRTAGILD